MDLHLNFSGFEQQLLVNQEPFIAKIYEGSGKPPEGYNVVKIPLNASDVSLLDWSPFLEKAKEYVQSGLLILWELEFALLDGSLEDEARFLTFQLNVEHFTQTIWPQFQDYTLGVSLYRGQAIDVSYLKSLAAFLPEEVVCFLFLDTTHVDTPAAYFQATNQEIFGHFRLIIKGPYAEKFPFAIPALAWEHHASALGFSAFTLQPTICSREVPLAICMSAQVDKQEFNHVIELLGERPFRVIPENLLTHEWDGVDDLIVFSNGLSDRGQRKLRGFSAAGGKIIMYPDDAALLQLLETSPASFLVFSPKNG